jgi:glyoxylase-like metal-dependent hydrolase (beta-lactamase superfamily II)
MKIHQIGGQSYDSNIYVIQAEKSLVIDCGTGGHHSEVMTRLKEIISPQEIDTIILSHRHFDHTGGAEDLKSALDAKLMVHENAAEALRQGDATTTAASAFGKKFPKLEVTELKEGEEIDLGDIKLKVIHIPGHSNGSIGLIHEDSKTLFSGDTVYTDGGIGRWDLPTGDYSQLVASIGRLTKMDISNLYPGHGPSSEGEGNRHIALGLKAAEMYGGF